MLKYILSAILVIVSSQGVAIELNGNSEISQINGNQLSSVVQKSYPLLTESGDINVNHDTVA